MERSVRKELKKIIKKTKLPCTVKDFLKNPKFYFDNIEIYKHKMSESFISYFKDSIDWYWVLTQNNTLTYSFLKKHKEYIIWDLVFKGKNVFLSEYHDYISDDEISKLLLIFKNLTS